MKENRFSPEGLKFKEKEFEAVAPFGDKPVIDLFEINAETCCPGSCTGCTQCNKCNMVF